jgi:hypothetical protein
MLKLATVLTFGLLTRADAHLIVPALLATNETQVSSLADGGFLHGLSPAGAHQTYPNLGLAIVVDAQGEIAHREFSFEMYFNCHMPQLAERSARVRSGRDEP